MKFKIANLLTKNEGENKLPRIYICGDAKGMSKDVWITFVEIVMTHCSKWININICFNDKIQFLIFIYF